MSILFKPRRMVCAIPGKEKTGYFAAKVNGGTIDLNGLCERISEKCSLTSADVKGVMEAMVKEFEIELLSGSSIKFGELGTFSASITSEVVGEKEDLKPHMVRVKTVTFLPSTRVKRIMRKARFVRLRDFNKEVYGMDEGSHLIDA